MLKPSFLSEEYLVSDEGYVLSKRDRTPLKYSVNHHGYAIINIRVDGKTKGVAVHTMVARAFCEGYKEGLTVNHKDGNKLNNKSDNLEWITNSENIEHARNILGKDNRGIKNPNHKSIKAYDKESKKLVYEFDCLIDAASFFAPNEEYVQLRRKANIISQCALGNRNSYRGYIWKYN